ncbi:unnamed protein product [Closterium sp. NIES-54]
MAWGLEPCLCWCSVAGKAGRVSGEEPSQTNPVPKPSCQPLLPFHFHFPLWYFTLQHFIFRNDIRHASHGWVVYAEVTSSLEPRWLKLFRLPGGRWTIEVLSLRSVLLGPLSLTIVAAELWMLTIISVNQRGRDANVYGASRLRTSAAARVFSCNVGRRAFRVRWICRHAWLTYVFVWRRASCYLVTSASWIC